MGRPLRTDGIKPSLLVTDRRTMKSYLVLAVLPGLAMALTCLPECEEGQTPEADHCTVCDLPISSDSHDKCPTGFAVLDECGVCMQCTKSTGEECGGIWNHAGVCTYYHTCAQAYGAPEDSQMPGLCCCDYKWVGGIYYTFLKRADPTTIPKDCVDTCIYVDEANHELCFGEGDLETECRHDG